MPNAFATLRRGILIETNAVVYIISEESCYYWVSYFQNSKPQKIEKKLVNLL